MFCTMWPRYTSLRRMVFTVTSFQNGVSPRWFSPPLRHVVKGSGRGDFFCVENQGNFAETVALQPQVKDVPHYRSCHRVNLQNVLVRRALPVAEGRIAAHILPSLEGRQLHCLDFVAGVPRIEVVHNIFQNDQHFIVLADGVYPIIEGDEAAAQRRKNEIADIDKGTKG